MHSIRQTVYVVIRLALLSDAEKRCPITKAQVCVTISHLILFPRCGDGSCSVGTGLSSVIGSDLIHTCEIGKEKFRDDWRTFATWSPRVGPTGLNPIIQAVLTALMSLSSWVESVFLPVCSQGAEPVPHGTLIHYR